MTSMNFMVELYHFHHECVIINLFVVLTFGLCLTLLIIYVYGFFSFSE